MSSKLRRSSALGKCVFIVDGRSSSVRSTRGRNTRRRLARGLGSCEGSPSSILSLKLPSVPPRLSERVTTTTLQALPPRSIQPSPPSRLQALPSNSSKTRLPPPPLSSHLSRMTPMPTFLNPNLSRTRLGLLLRRRVLVLLHTPDLNAFEGEVGGPVSLSLSLRSFLVPTRREDGKSEVHTLIIAAGRSSSSSLVEVKPTLTSSSRLWLLSLSPHITTTRTASQGRMGFYIPEDSIERLRAYKYSSIDKSLTSVSCFLHLTLDDSGDSDWW